MQFNKPIDKNLYKVNNCEILSMGIILIKCIFFMICINKYVFYNNYSLVIYFLKPRYLFISSFL